MPTLDERVTILETTVVDMMDQILARARTAEVATLEAARDTIKDAQDHTNSSVATRLGKLERAVASFQLLLARIPRYDENGFLPTDLLFAEDVGPVIQDEDGAPWRIIVDTDGTLGTVEAP